MNGTKETSNEHDLELKYTSEDKYRYFGEVRYNWEKKVFLTNTRNLMYKRKDFLYLQQHNFREIYFSNKILNILEMLFSLSN